MDKELTEKTTIEIKECTQKQSKVCEEKSYPYFAPSDGVCWKCRRNIYQNYIIDGGISKGENGERFITGCPHCSRSYCD